MLDVNVWVMKMIMSHDESSFQILIVNKKFWVALYTWLKLFVSLMVASTY
jgi:hypothetical protein